ncbi:flagellar hook assembly protein FlgD [Pseudomonas cremoricolorata]|uniref:Basal-body rod modification protein FlgD n=1 Tax=Pseudomonas cremoricolorata TaxID=157783 RepID=A0A089YE74_9PSED|nr:flagellar hook assembly protein FlgD [Pseudomonas cremoricolorata]AIR90053.1 flagellar basal body rod modification protein FlgD [Pseudomonas cremoricolorata]
MNSTDSVNGSSYLTSLQQQRSSTNASSGTAGSALGKDAFLQLLVTQMKNQNPLDPQQNGEFVAQLAQFSSLESMQTLNSSVNSILQGFQSSTALQASSLVGRNVVVQTDTASVDTSKDMKGSVNLSASSTAVKVGVYNSQGDLVRTLDLGSKSGGLAEFTWDGRDAKGEVAPAGAYTFKATADIKGTATAMTTNLPATVNSVTTGVNGSEMMLNLAGLGSVPLSKVQVIGI